MNYMSQVSFNQRSTSNSISIGQTKPVVIAQQQTQPEGFSSIPPSTLPANSYPQWQYHNGQVDLGATGSAYDRAGYASTPSPIPPSTLPADSYPQWQYHNGQVDPEATNRVYDRANYPKTAGTIQP